MGKFEMILEVFPVGEVCSSGEIADRVEAAMGRKSPTIRNSIAQTLRTGLKYGYFEYMGQTVSDGHLVSVWKRVE